VAQFRRRLSGHYGFEFEEFWARRASNSATFANSDFDLRFELRNPQIPLVHTTIDHGLIPVSIPLPRLSSK
jgi:hypothetical protein